MSVPNSAQTFKGLIGAERIEAENADLRAQLEQERQAKDEARQLARDLFGDLPSLMSDYLFRKEYAPETERYPWLKAKD